EARRGALAPQADWAAPQVGVAGSYRHEGRPEEARGAAAAAIAAEPANPAGYVALAEAKRRAADFAGARAGYQAALAQAPDDLAALSGLATLETDLGNLAAAREATEHLQEVAGREPRTEFFVAIGHAMIGQKRYGDATDAFQQALKLTPVDASLAYGGLGEIQLAQKRAAAARGPLEQATAARPASARARGAWGAHPGGQKERARAGAALRPTRAPGRGA